MRNIKQPWEATLREAGLIPVNLWTVDQQQKQAPATQIDSCLVSESNNQLLVPPTCVAEPSAEPSTWTKHLHLICLLFHILLVIIFLALAWVATSGKEHHVVFSIENQQTVSFWCKIVTTVFGTVSNTI
jgi:hypothetical protein